MISEDSSKSIEVPIIITNVVHNIVLALLFEIFVNTLPAILYQYLI